MGYGFLDLAKDVSEEKNIPLLVEEMWAVVEEIGLLEKLASSGKTPVRTLSARLYVDIKNNGNSLFTQPSKRPAKFFLKDKTASFENHEKAKEKLDKEHKFHERDLYILLI